MKEKYNDNEETSLVIYGRNAVLEAFRSDRTIDRIYVQEGVADGTLQSILRAAKKTDTIISFVSKDRLNKYAEGDKHQGVVAMAAAYDYAEVDDILNAASKKGEPPFIIVLDDIEDPHNLGAIIRTANQAGAHGVIIPKRHAVGLKVTNISRTIDELKEKGIWFACADMSGELMYNCNLTGAIGLVIGSEGSGVSRLVKEKCDFVVRVPMFGQIDSLNASVAAGVLAYEIVRQRLNTNK